MEKNQLKITNLWTLYETINKIILHSKQFVNHEKIHTNSYVIISTILFTFSSNYISTLLLNFNLNIKKYLLK